MYNEMNSSPQVFNTIFWANTAANGGAQIYNFDPGSSPDVNDCVVQDGYAGTRVIITEPTLGPLGTYGGTTQTLPLRIGSSAIDMGNDATCTATDQRGVARPQGLHCDIGAFELRFFLVYLPLVVR